MSRFVSEHCWILHRRPWRESSMLIELFSLEHGRTGLVGRGLRRQSSPWRGLGEPFVPLRVTWTRRGDLGTLTDIEPTGARLALSGEALWCGLYASELVLVLMGRDEPLPEVFAGYSRLLAQLQADTHRHAPLRQFELALLNGLGVAPDLGREALQGQPIVPEACYQLDPEAGFVRASSGPGVYSGQAILSLAGASGTDMEVRRQAREIMRVLIDHQLDGRPLKTRELFRSL